MRSNRHNIWVACCTAAFGSALGTAAFANGPITPADNVRVNAAEVNNLQPDAVVNVSGSSIYFDTQDRTQSHGNYFEIATGGIVSDQFGAFPASGTSMQVPGATFALSGQAGGPNGILRSATYAAAGSNATANADALTFSKASLGDVLTLAHDATISLTGQLDGTVFTNAGPALTSANVSLKLYLLNRNDPDAESGYLVIGGYSFDLQGSDTPGVGHNVDLAINVPVDLTAGSYYLYAYLETDAIAETSNNSASALTDFGHTLSFGVSAPAAAGLTSQLGTVPISVPEPAAASALALAAMALRRRR